MKFKVISGGQTGADILGIVWALINNLHCEINSYKGYKIPVEDKNTILCKVNIVSDKDPPQGWIERRKYNIKHSDVTIIFIIQDLRLTRGSLGTFNDANRMNKPVLLIDLRDKKGNVPKVKKFIKKHKPKVINIAGQRSLKINMDGETDNKYEIKMLKILNKAFKFEE